MHESSDQTLFLLALAKMPGIGGVTARQLIGYCGGVKQVFEAGYRKLARIPGVGEHTVRTVLKRETLRIAEKEMTDCSRMGIAIVTYLDKDYPRRLLPLYDAPLVLYLEGGADLNTRRTVGIVGTRRITDYGRTVTDRIVRDLAPFSPLIVSGLAYGVDIVAHRAALKASLDTVGVMANGADMVYPRAHFKTAAQMVGQGGVVTECGLGTRPDFQRFPARNRIIAGLSDVLIIVESAARGGGLITAEFAANYHRDVYAVPGRLDQPMSEGCNRLIGQNKAALFVSVSEMVADLRWEGGAFSGQTLPLFESTGNRSVFEGFSVDESQLLALLKGGDFQIDELQWQSGLSSGKIASILLNLEFKGVVKCLPGKKYGLA